MKAKFEVGAEIDFLSPAEFDERLRAALGAWRTELARGVKWQTITEATTVDAATNFSLGNVGPDKIGPNAGMLWSVTRITVAGAGFVAATDTWNLYRNEAQDSNMLVGGITTRTQFFDLGALVVQGPEKLVIAGTGNAAGDSVVVTVGAAELPVQLGYLLLG